MRSGEPRAQRQVESGVRSPALDGIRGLAISLVLVWHYLYGQLLFSPGSIGAYATKLLSLTWAGVDLFFVLSGYLIGGILLDNRAAPNYFQVFYVRRVLRIFPLYYASLAAMVLARAMPGVFQGPEFAWLLGNPMPLWTYVLYLQNVAMAGAGDHGAAWMGITWSLAIEEQFYLLLPVIIRYVPARLLPWLSCAFVLSAIMFRAALLAGQSGGGFSGFVLLPGRWDALFVGVLGACWVRHPGFDLYGTRLLPMLRWIVVLGLCSTLMLLAAGQGIGSRGMALGGHTVIAASGLAVILLATLNPTGLVGKSMVNPVLVWLGTVSYGVYLLHQPIAGLAHAILGGQFPRIAGTQDVAITALAFGLTLGCAAVSWRYFEQPLVKLGRRVAYGG